MTIEVIFRAWEASRNLHELAQGATEAQLDALAERIGAKLPEDFKKLYRHSDGGSFCGGNTSFDSIAERHPGMSLLDAPTRLRGWDWIVPNECLPFGGDGTGGVYMLWLGAAHEPWSTPIIIHPKDNFEEPNLCPVATSLVSFLAYRTAYYLIIDDEDCGSALDILGVPLAMRSDDPGDEEYAALVAWADPKLPVKDPNQYEYVFDGDGLRRLFAG